MAVYATRLPDGARVWAAVGSPKAWDESTYLLHAVEYNTRLNVWAKTKDGQNGRKQPKPSPTPQDRMSEKQRVERETEKARAFRERQKRRTEQ